MGGVNSGKRGPRYQRQCKLTARQRKLLKEIPKHRTLQAASDYAGYADSSGARRALKSIQEKMPQILDRHGLTDDYIARKVLKPGLSAYETRLCSLDGKFSDSRKVPDFRERREYATLICRLKGEFPKENGSISVNNFVGVGVLPRPAANELGIAVPSEPQAN